MSKEHIKQFGVICTVISTVIISLMAGCTPTRPKQGTTLDHQHATLNESIAFNQAIERKSRRIPQSVSDALLPRVGSVVTPSEQMSRHRFDVVADKMPAKIFFTGLVEGTPFNMLVNPDVTGTISLNLKSVTIEEAMDAVRDMYGYEYRKTSYGYEVLPQTLETQLFTVNYLDVKRVGKSSTSISSGEVTNKVGTVSGGGAMTANNSVPPAPGATDSSVTGTVDTSSEVNFWRDLETTLKTMIGNEKGKTIIENPQAGVVIVHAYPNELHQIARYLDRIQSNLQRQVVLEAKILEVTLSNNFQAGIDWSLFKNPIIKQSGNNLPGGNNNLLDVAGSGSFSDTNLNAFDSIFTVAHTGSFGVLLRFLQTQGNLQVLSSPRISTVNNQKAVIKVGQDEFFVTGVSTSNTVVGSSTIPSQQVNLTPFFSGITLDVTPQISRDGTVILHIHPAISVVKNQQKNVNLGSDGTGGNNNLSLPLALSTIRESDNIVRAKNGQVVVIGGLMQNTMVEDTNGTPILSKIPFIGAAFRRTSQVATKTELVILLRPVLVDNRELIGSLQRTDKHFQAMKRGFHEGGWPEIFGNEGERPSS